jgi:hypothetical protein
MNHQRLRITYVGEMRQHLHAFDETDARFRAAFDAERQDAGGAVGQVFERERFIAIAG